MASGDAMQQRRVGWVGLTWLIVLGTWLGLVTEARASSVRPTVELSYIKTPGAWSCPPDKVLREEVVRLMEDDPFELGAPLLAEVEVSREGRLMLAIVSIRNRAGETLWRNSLSTMGFSCDELVLKAAFNLVIGMGVIERQPEPQPLLLRVYKDRIEMDEQKTACLSQREPCPLCRVDVCKEPKKKEEEEKVRPMDLWFGLTPVVAVGYTPRMAAGGVGTLEARWSHWSAGLDVRILMGFLKEIDNLYMAGAGFVCWRPSVVFACGLLELGLLSTEAAVRTDYLTENGRSPSVRLGLRLGVEWPLSRRFALRGQAEILGAPSQMSFRLEPNGGVIWTASVLAGSLGVGVIARL